MDTTTTSTGMRTNMRNDGGSADIEADIHRTRAQMDETLDALSERLQPRHLLDDLLDYFRSRRASGRGGGAGRQRAKRIASGAARQAKSTAGQASRTVVHQVREHPMPSLLIGAGLAWWLYDSSRDEEDYEMYYVEEELDEGYLEPAYEGLGETPGPEQFALPSHYSEQHEGGKAKLKSKADAWKHKASGTAGKAGDAMRRARARAARRGHALQDRAREKGAVWKEQARHTCERGVDKFKETSQDHPLSVGIGFLALGVLAGALLPSTEREDEWMGSQRDELLDRSRAAARDAVERGKHVAKTTAEAARAEAERQGLTPEALKEKSQAVARETRETAREETRHEAEEMKSQNA